METGCICSSLGPCKEHSPDFDVCECGDYRRDHEDGSGYCRMPNNLCHAFKECLVFRISQRADGLPIHPDTTTINALMAERDALAKRVEELEEEVERGRKLIERDRTGMAAALNEIRRVAIGYGWIPNGELGSYTAAGCGEGEELTEEVLRQEVGRCLDAIRGLAVRALAASGDCVNEMFATRRAGRPSHKV